MKRSMKIELLLIALLFVFGAFLHVPEAEAAGKTVTYELTTLNGKTITDKSFGSFPQLLVFYHSKMSNGKAVYKDSASFFASTLPSLEEYWVGELQLEVILISADAGATQKEQAKFAETYAPYLFVNSPFFRHAAPDMDLLKRLHGTTAVDDCYCVLVQNGKVLDEGEGFTDIDQCLDQFEGKLDTSRMYQTVQITVKQDYASAFDVLAKVNQERKAAGLTALKMDKDLLAAAMQRAAEISVKFDYVRPSARRSIYVHPKAAQENIAAGYESAAEVMQGWMGSDENKDIILGKNYKTIGVGAVKVNGVMCWVQLFGTAADSDAVAKKADHNTEALVTAYPKIKLYAGYFVDGDMQMVLDPWISEVVVGKTKKINLHLLSDLENSWLHATMLNSKLQFICSDTSIATISTKGVITGVKMGKATITVRSRLSKSSAPALGILSIEVVKKPSITKQPQDLTVQEGEKAVFKVKATGGALQYQWYYRKTESDSWTVVQSNAGKTANYSLKPKARHDGYQYRCRIKNAAGTVYSNVVTLHLNTPEDKPVITQQPKDAAVFAGDKAIFTVKASGTGLSYQWYYRKTETGSWIAVSSTAGKKSVYSLTTVLRHDGYQYRCEVKNALGTVYSDVGTLLLGPRLITVPEEKDLNVTAGERLTLTVEAEGRELTYKWRYRKSETDPWQDVKAASGKTASFTMTVEERHDGYQYMCFISNAAGTVSWGRPTLRVSTGE